MNIDNLKNRLHYKKKRLIELEFDSEHAHSFSVRTQARSQANGVKISIDILETRIKELE